MVEGSSPSAPTNFLGVNSRSTFSLNALSAVEHELVDKPPFAQLDSPHITPSGFPFFPHSDLNARRKGGPMGPFPSRWYILFVLSVFTFFVFATPAEAIQINGTISSTL